MSVFSSAELDGLAIGLADTYTTRFGAAPVSPAVRFDDDVLTFLFDHGLSEEEENLRREFRMVDLRERRERFLEPAGAHLVVPVEDFAHSRVRFHVGLFDPGPTSTMMLFGFDDPADDDRGGLVGWAARVRGEARRLRRESVGAREAHAQIRAELRAAREERAARFRDP